MSHGTTVPAVLNWTGQAAAHPLVAVIDLLQRQQLAIYRTLGLGRLAYCRRLGRAG